MLHGVPIFIRQNPRIIGVFSYDLHLEFDHTTPSSENSPDLPASRLNVVRHFSTVSVDVSFALSISLRSISTPDRARYWRTTHTLGNQRRVGGVAQRNLKKWWEGVADHIIDKIVSFFCSELAL